MIEAEREARASQGLKGPNKSSSAENTFMNSLKHEISSEKVSNTARLQNLLKSQIEQLKMNMCKTEEQKLAYKTLREAALETRSLLIVQREAAGFTTNNAAMIEVMFPIPN